MLLRGIRDEQISKERPRLSDQLRDNGYAPVKTSRDASTLSKPPGGTIQVSRASFASRRSLLV